MKDYKYCLARVKECRKYDEDNENFRQCRDELFDLAEETGDERIHDLAVAFLDLGLALIDLDDAKSLVRDRNEKLDRLLGEE